MRSDARHEREEVNALAVSTTPNTGFYVGVIVLAIFAPRAAVFGYLMIAITPYYGCAANGRLNELSGWRWIQASERGAAATIGRLASARFWSRPGSCPRSGW